MLSENQIRSVALFFLYTILDEHAARPIAERTCAILKNKLARVNEESIDAKNIVISTCKSQFDKMKKNLIRGQVSMTLTNSLILPNENLEAWVRFHREASDDELLTVIFTRVMGFSEHDVAEAFGVSEGTARYRLGHGIKRLGELQRGMHRGIV